MGEHGSLIRCGLRRRSQGQRWLVTVSCWPRSGRVVSHGFRDAELWSEAAETGPHLRPIQRCEGSAEPAENSRDSGHRSSAGDSDDTELCPIQRGLIALTFACTYLFTQPLSSRAESTLKDRRLP